MEWAGNAQGNSPLLGRGLQHHNATAAPKAVLTSGLFGTSGCGTILSKPCTSQLSTRAPALRGEQLWSELTLYPASLRPTSHILHPSNPTSVHPTSCQTIPNPASHIPCRPQILRPATRMPHPTIPSPKSLLLQSLIPHPSSPISHHSILNPISHIPHPSVLYPTSQVMHPTSCISTPHISQLSVPCLSILNPTPHIPPSHILHPASHIPCLPIPYSTSLYPMPSLCLLMGCCAQGTHQLSMPVPKPSSSSQPSSSSSSGSKGVISAGRAGSGVQELATRREPQTMGSLLPLPRASSSSSLRTCTSV